MWVLTTLIPTVVLLLRYHPAYHASPATARAQITTYIGNLAALLASKATGVNSMADLTVGCLPD